jgi:hypothetical protein
MGRRETWLEAKFLFLPSGESPCKNPAVLSLKTRRSLVPVVHTCNPSSRGRDQEDCNSKPAQFRFMRPCLEKYHHKKRAGGVAQGVGPEFKPQYHQKKKKKGKEKMERKCISDRVGVKQ